MFDHSLIETIEAMQGNRVLPVVWQQTLKDLENAYDRGEIGSSVYSYGCRLLLKVR